MSETQDFILTTGRWAFINYFLKDDSFARVAQELAEKDGSVSWPKIYQDALDILTHRERQVEALFYGFVDQRPTKVAIARELGLSSNRICQLVQSLDCKLMRRIGVIVVDRLRHTQDHMIWEANIALVGFSDRTFHCLRRSGYLTLRNVAAATKEDLMEIRGFGKKCLAEVEKKLAENDLRLRCSKAC